jgi:hypothetical protein
MRGAALNPLHFAIFGLLSLGGCGSEPLDSAADAGRAADAGAGASDASTGVQVEIGVGEDGFMPVVEDQRVELVLGPQGGGRFEGHHVSVAVRTRGLSPLGVKLTFRLLAEDRTEVAVQPRVFDLARRGDDLVAYGVRPRVSDCCLVAERALYLAVEAEDAEGKKGSDERRVRAGPCLDERGVSRCP